MQIIINIVGLRYYALASGRWQRLFDDSGGITRCVSGTKLVLRRSCESAVDCAVEALSDGERWGNVADSEKLMLAAYMKQRGVEQITTTVISGDRDMHGLQVRAEIDTAAGCEVRKDFTRYSQWAASAASFPTLMPTVEEQLFSTLLASLNAVADGGGWNHSLFTRLRPLIGIDLSDEAMRALNALALKARAIDDAHAAADAHRLECDIVHLGSAESRRQWIDHWRTQTDTPQAATLRALAAHCEVGLLEPLLLSFPGNVFALMATDPVLAVARLHYARLPRDIVRKFLSLWLLWEGRGREAEGRDGGAPDRPNQMTAQQVAVFAYYLLDNQGTLDCTSRQSIADFFALLTGYKAKTLRQRLDFQGRFETRRVRADITRVASLLRNLMPGLYEKMTNELESN